MMGLERSATRRICVLPSSAPSALRPLSTVSRSSGVARRQGTVVARAYKVELKLNGGEVAEIEVEEDEYILDAVENAGLEVPYDCRMGVCMQCPAKLTSGEVDQTEGMISDDVAEKGYVLMCVAKCQSDLTMEQITEVSRKSRPQRRLWCLTGRTTDPPSPFPRRSQEELLDEQLMTSDA